MPIANPEDITGCLGWGVVSESGHVTLDGSSLVNQFGKPGMTVVLDQASGGDAPAPGATIGAEAAIQFDGSDWMLDWSYSPAGSAHTFGVMVEWSGSNGVPHHLFGTTIQPNARRRSDGQLEIQADGTPITTPVSLATPYAVVLKFTGGAGAAIWIDGVEAVTGNAGTSATPQRVTLGGPDDKPHMRVSRWAYYDAVLADTDIEDLSNWLAAGQAAPTYIPQNLVATAIDHDSIGLTWDAVAGISAYDIERDGVVIVSDHPTNSYTDNGLASSTLYEYRVRSVL